MPTPPPPRTYVCAACGWKKAVFPCSDALSLVEDFEVCPGCGSAAIDCRAVSVFEQLAKAWRQRLSPASH